MDTAGLNKPDPAQIERQANELLYYKRLLLRQQINQRTDARVKQLVAIKTDSKPIRTPEAADQVISVTPASAGTTLYSAANPAAFAATSDESSLKDPLFPSNVSPKKRTTTAPGKRKSPPLAPEQLRTNKIAKSLPAVAQFADNIPVATYVPFNPGMNQMPRIPHTIVTAWQRMDQAAGHTIPNPPTCKCRGCPYSSTPDVTPTMLVRHNLLAKLWCIEKELYGL